MTYGTLPIVRETGGLKDTVLPYNQYTGEGTGFSFANYNADEMLACIWNAMDVYYNNKQAWANMQKQAMAADYSWDVSAERYIDMYCDISGVERPVKKAEKKAPAKKKKDDVAFEAKIRKDFEESENVVAQTAKEPQIKEIKNPFEEGDSKKTVKKTEKKTAKKETDKKALKTTAKKTDIKKTETKKAEKKPAVKKEADTKTKTSKKSGK
jgi:starch synthase